MRVRIGIAAVAVGLGAPALSCIVVEECEIVGLDLVITDFGDDYVAPAGLSFCGPEQGPCVGADGAIAFLPEALQIDSPTDEDLYGAATGWWDGGRHFAVGDAGTVLSTAGSRIDWRIEDSGTDVDLRAVATGRDESRLVVAAGGGVAVRSRDGGGTWEASSLPEGVVIDRLVRLTDGSILGGGPDGRLWLTTDGASFTESDSPTTEPITALYVPYDRALLADAAGRIFERTVDGDWAVQEVPGQAPVLSLTGHTLVWALRSDGTLAYRFDGGEWLRSDYEASAGTALAAGEYDGFLHDPFSWDDEYFSGWLQSMCIVDGDGQVHSASAWLDAVTECRT